MEIQIWIKNKKNNLSKSFIYIIHRCVIMAEDIVSNNGEISMKRNLTNSIIVFGIIKS